MVLVELRMVQWFAGQTLLLIIITLQRVKTKNKTKSENKKNVHCNA